MYIIHWAYYSNTESGTTTGSYETDSAERAGEYVRLILSKPQSSITVTRVA
jgi:hypothetical protein